MTELNDKRFRLIGIPLIGVFVSFTFLFALIFILKITWWKVVLQMIVHFSLLWECNRQILMFTRRKFPGSSNTMKRYWILAVLFTFTAFFFSLLMMQFIAYTNFWKYQLTGADFAFIFGITW